MPGEPHGLDQDYVDFYPSGTQAAGEFCCASCGYGIVFRGQLRRCPMCGESTWETAVWRPLSREAGGAAWTASAAAARDRWQLAQANYEKGRQG